MTAAVQKLMEYQVKFENLGELKKIREDKRKEYDYRRSKVESLTEKPSKNPLELPKEKELLSNAKAEYEAMNEEAKAQIEQLFADKHEAFDAVLPIIISETIEYQKRLGSDLAPLSQFSNMKAQPSTKVTRAPLKQQEEPEKKTGPVLPGRTKTVIGTVPPKFDVEWFYLDSGMNQCGPVAYKDLKANYKSGKLNSDSYVFEANMSDWAQIGNLNELEMNLKK
jgi:hypothetical protein